MQQQQQPSSRPATPAPALFLANSGQFVHFGPREPVFICGEFIADAADDSHGHTDASDDRPDGETSSSRGGIMGHLITTTSPPDSGNTTVTGSNGGGDGTMEATSALPRTDTGSPPIPRTMFELYVEALRALGAPKPVAVAIVTLIMTLAVLFITGMTLYRCARRSKDDACL